MTTFLMVPFLPFRYYSVTLVFGDHDDPSVCVAKVWKWETAPCIPLRGKMRRDVRIRTVGRIAS
jgi:hypothetical protein